MTAHSPIVLLGDISAETLAQLREYLAKLPGRAPQDSREPQLSLSPALPAGTVTPGLLDVVALRSSHFAKGHTIQADLQGKRPGQLAKWGREYLVDAIDLLDRGPRERARARVKLARAAALLLAELDRLDAQDDAEAFPAHDGDQR